MSDNQKKPEAASKRCDRCDDLELRCLELDAQRVDLLKRVAQAKAREDHIEAEIRGEYERKLEALKKSLVEGKPVDPYFKVQACTPNGEFWAIKRKFTAEPIKVPLRELTADQILELEQTPKKFLSVMKVTHE